MDMVGVLAYLALGAALWAIVSHIRKGDREFRMKRLAEQAERQDGKGAE